MKKQRKSAKKERQAGNTEVSAISAAELQGQSFLGLVQWGAARILEEAVRDEITRYLGRRHYEHRGEDAEFRGYRNGTRETTIDTPSGQVVYDRQLLAHAPDFHSQWHTPYMRRPEEFAEAVTDMYVHGVSTRKVKKALKASAGEKTRLKRSTVSRITKKLRDEFDVWKKRDLSGLKVVYLFLDAIHIGMRLQSTPKEAVLIAHAVLEDGSFETISIGLGHREGNRCWGDFVADMKRRGLKNPLMVISDGNQGVINAIDSHWPAAYRQRCVKHKTANVLDKVPKDDQTSVRKDLNRIFYGATSLEQAKQAVKDFQRKYRKKYPSAVECLERDLDQALTFYLFPAKHWRRIRTSNCLERMNLEIRRRLNAIGRHPSEIGCLALVHRICQNHCENKRAFKTNDLIHRLWKKLRTKKEEMIEQLDLDLYAA